MPAGEMWKSQYFKLSFQKLVFSREKLIKLSETFYTSWYSFGCKKFLLLMDGLSFLFLHT